MSNEGYPNLRRGAMVGVRARTNKPPRVQTSLWLEPEDLARLKQMAQEEKISMAEAVERLTRKAWEKRERKRIGLSGDGIKHAIPL